MSIPNFNETKEYVYWEKQGKDRLCGLHCLNSLLQGPYFTEIDLANIALELDQRERLLMQTPGTRMSQTESLNVSDDGFFNISVIVSCLRQMNISYAQFTPDSLNNSDLASSEFGFICNLDSHWLSLRKISGKWYNLDSMANFPKYISNFYLDASLASWLAEGYNIFTIRPDYGILPEPILQETFNSNQHYIKASDIIYQTQSSRDNTNSPNTAQSNNEVHKKKAENGFNSPGNTLVEKPKTVKSDDPELEKAITESIEFIVRSLVIPEEPPESVDNYTFAIRLTSSKTIKRCFSPYDNISLIFDWLENLTIDSTDVTPKLATRETYSLISQFPKTKLSKIRIFGQNYIYFTKEATEVDVSQQKIQYLGWKKSERLFLS